MLAVRLAVLVLAASAGYLLDPSRVVSSGADLRNAVNVLAGIDATLLGFLVSAGALLYAVANTRLVRNLQRTGHFNKLLADLFLDSGAFLLAVVVAIACLLLPAPIGPEPATRLFVGVQVLVAANVAAFLLLLPVGWKLWSLLLGLEPDGGDALE